MKALFVLKHFVPSLIISAHSFLNMVLFVTYPSLFVFHFYHSSLVLLLYVDGIFSTSQYQLKHLLQTLFNFWAVNFQWRISDPFIISLALRFLRQRVVFIYPSDTMLLLYLKFTEEESRLDPTHLHAIFFY